MKIKQIHSVIALRRHKKLKDLIGQNKIINTEFLKATNKTKRNDYPVL